MSAIFSCREAVRLASEALDRPLGVRQRMALRMHLAMCAACRAYQHQIATLDRLVRGRATAEPPEGERLSDEARERIRRALQGE